ncbi:MAG: hypothetical protein QOJ25_1869 [Solirubrobacteraceae bacterium]|jgi:hypothetical protein|nr:hypothetical protein [Solirubrobacteraceae bacterium]
MSSSGSSQNIARPIALVFGVVYLGAGLVGFAATGFHGFVTPAGATFLGLKVNIFHNIVHIGIGTILIIASRVPDAAMTQGIMLGVGIIYVAATLLGFLGRLPIIGITTAQNPDNFFHLVSASVILFGGLAGAYEQRSADAAFQG